MILSLCRPLYRLIIQIILSLYVIFSTDVYLSNLGNLFGFGEIQLGILVYLSLFFVLLE